MKKILLIAVAAIGIVACKMADKKAETPGAKLTQGQIDSVRNDSTKFTTIQWLDSMPVNLGKMADGDEKEVVFHFKNTGDKPLVILETRGTCGCTTPERPEGAIPPGQEGVIRAKFNSKGMGGRIASKTVSVIANTNPSNYHELTFQAEVTTN
jgi:hypothetical protein